MPRVGPHSVLGENLVVRALRIWSPRDYPKEDGVVVRVGVQRGEDAAWLAAWTQAELALNVETSTLLTGQNALNYPLQKGDVLIVDWEGSPVNGVAVEFQLSRAGGVSDAAVEERAQGVAGRDLLAPLFRGRADESIGKLARQLNESGVADLSIPVYLTDHSVEPHTHEGTEIKSTGEAASKQLTSDGEGGASWVAGGGGSGDMTKAVYDQDDDGIVDKAESVDDGAGNAKTAAEIKTHIDSVANPHETKFTGLGDTPSTYADASGLALVVNPDEDGVVFTPFPSGIVNYRYRFSTNTAATDPGSGYAKQNNADPTLATRLYVSETDRTGTDRSVLLAALGPRDYVGYRDFNTADHYTYVISDEIIDKGGWVEIPVVYVRHSGSLSDNEQIYLAAAFGSYRRFTQLLDTPSAYTGKARNVAKVNDGEDALVFAGEPATWKGEWASGQYYANDVVRDGAWLMIANKDTQDRPSPQPSGPRDYLLPDSPTWSTASQTNYIISGMRIKDLGDQLFLISKIRVWVHDVTSSMHYDVYVRDNTSGQIRYVLGFLGDAVGGVGWLEIVFPIALTEHTDLDVLLVSEKRSSTTNYSYEWVYEGTSQNSGPASGGWNRNNQHNTLRISDTDDGGTDRSTALTSAQTPGTVIRCADKATPANYYEYQVIAGSDEGTYHEYAVTLVGTGGSGPTTLALSTVSITVPVAASTTYVRLPSHFTGTPEVSGYLQIGSGTPTINQDAHGIDVEVQEYATSPDWDVMANSESGGGSGASTFTGLSDTPEEYTGKALMLARVNADEDALEFSTAPTSPASAVTMRAGLKNSAEGTNPGEGYFNWKADTTLWGDPQEVYFSTEDVDGIEVAWLSELEAGDQLYFTWVDDGGGLTGSGSRVLTVVSKTLKTGSPSWYKIVVTAGGLALSLYQHNVISVERARYIPRDFDDLNDTPSSKTGKKYQTARVNAAETDLEYVPLTQFGPTLLSAPVTYQKTLAASDDHGVAHVLDSWPTGGAGGDQRQVVIPSSGIHPGFSFVIVNSVTSNVERVYLVHSGVGKVIYYRGGAGSSNLRMPASGVPYFCTIDSNGDCHVMQSAPRSQFHNLAASGLSTPIPTASPGVVATLGTYYPGYASEVMMDASVETDCAFSYTGGWHYIWTGLRFVGLLTRTGSMTYGPHFNSGALMNYPSVANRFADLVSGDAANGKVVVQLLMQAQVAGCTLSGYHYQGRMDYL